MSYIVAEESFDSLTAFWNSPGNNLNPTPIFIFPGWLRTWWQTFGDGYQLYLRSVRKEQAIIGIAPLMVKDKKACFIGSSNVCDYLDFAIVPGREKEFFVTLLDYLAQNNRQIELGIVRKDSSVMTSLIPLAQERGFSTVCKPDDVSVEMNLPSGWNEYLEGLGARHRHETERKLRRLYEAGRVSYRVFEDDSMLGNFMKLFTISRKDKAAFMTHRMESLFKQMASVMAQAGLLKFGVLYLDDLPVAIVMGFDYNNRIYLYNSGYDPEYRSLSAGLLSKVLFIKESIQKGKETFDFLKGGEVYKYHLGGKEIPLFNCQIKLVSRQVNR